MLLRIGSLIGQLKKGSFCDEKNSLSYKGKRLFLHPDPMFKRKGPELANTKDCGSSTPTTSTRPPVSGEKTNLILQFVLFQFKFTSFYLLFIWSVQEIFNLNMCMVDLFSLWSNIFYLSSNGFVFLCSFFPCWNAYLLHIIRQSSFYNSYDARFTFVVILSQELHLGDYIDRAFLAKKNIKKLFSRYIAFWSDGQYEWKGTGWRLEASYSHSMGRGYHSRTWQGKRIQVFTSLSTHSLSHHKI